LDEFNSQDQTVAQKQKQALTNLLANVCPSFQKRKFHLFAVDCTPGPRVFSPTLEDRTYVYSPNAVCGNKPVTIGHKYSIAAYLPEKSNTDTPPWLVPVACARVNTTQNAEILGTVYGDLHKINDSTTWHHPDEHIKFSQLTGTGKILSIKIEAWNEVIMRGKKGVKLSDYPIRLLRVQVFKDSGELLFKRPLWLTAAGNRRMELSLFDVYSSYRQRFDIEHFFRFGKTRLLMDKIQTPDVEHEEAWWQLVMIAYTQLYLSRSIVDNLANPWERYLPSFKQSETIKQPTIVQKDFERIIRMIGTPAQPPKPRKNAPGRQFGDTQAKRTRHPVVKKHKNTAATEKMIA
jgi:hypothetical protein